MKDPENMTYAEYNKYLMNIESVLIVAINNVMSEIKAPRGIDLSIDLDLINANKMGNLHSRFVLNRVKINKYFVWYLK